MTSRTSAVVLAAFAIGLTVQSRGFAQRGGGAEVLTNESVISMTAAKVDRTILIAKINTTKNTFDVTSHGLVSLTQGTVNAEVIKTMLSAAANPRLGPPPPKTPEVFDNQSVIMMVGGKVNKDVIKAKIQGTKSTFDVSSNGLVSLSQAKVPADVIQAMVAKTGGGL